jgi:hypothetical protein
MAWNGHVEVVLIKEGVDWAAAVVAGLKSNK